MGKVRVYYFEKPTIGYCPKCEQSAEYHDRGGLTCPNNAKHKISVFEYNDDGPYPEGDDEDEE